MGRYEYIVKRIDGDYAILIRTDIDSDDEKIVARALLPESIQEGTELIYENFEYDLK